MFSINANMQALIYERFRHVQRVLGLLDHWVCAQNAESA